jgi:hypothetical protein
MEPMIDVSQNFAADNSSAIPLGADGTRCKPTRLRALFFFSTCFKNRRRRPFDRWIRAENVCEGWSIKNCGGFFWQARGGIRPLIAKEGNDSPAERSNAITYRCRFFIDDEALQELGSRICDPDGSLP